MVVEVLADGGQRLAGGGAALGAGEEGGDRPQHRIGRPGEGAVDAQVDRRRGNRRRSGRGMSRSHGEDGAPVVGQQERAQPAAGEPAEAAEELGVGVGFRPGASRSRGMMSGSSARSACGASQVGEGPPGVPCRGPDGRQGGRPFGPAAAEQVELQGVARGMGTAGAGTVGQDLTRRRLLGLARRAARRRSARRGCRRSHALSRQINLRLRQPALAVAAGAAGIAAAPPRWRGTL